MSNLACHTARVNIETSEDLHREMATGAPHQPGLDERTKTSCFDMDGKSATTKKEILCEIES
jgi:hypothetical protein